MTNSVSQVDGVSDKWYLPAGSVSLLGEKRYNGLCPPLCVGESCPPALALMPDTSIPPCMPLIPRCWSSGVSLSTSSCGFFKRNCLGLPSVSSTNSIPDSFCSQKLWGHIFLALEPLAGGPGVGLGLLTPKISLPNFHPPHLDVGPAYSISLTLQPVWMVVVSLIP